MTAGKRWSAGLLAAYTGWLVASFVNHVPALGLDVSGRWEGTWISDVYAEELGGVIAVLRQDGERIAGDLTLPEGGCFGRATVEGTVSGNRVRGSFRGLDVPVEGTFDGSVDGDQMTGTWSIPEDCEDRGRFELVRASTPAVPTSTPTPRPLPPCGGDCDRNGTVSISELVTGVNIALGRAALSGCPASDLDGNGRVTINELIVAVDAALRGCVPPVAPTATATRTTGQATATPTSTATPLPVSIARRAVGTTVILTRIFPPLANIMTLLVPPSAQPELKAGKRIGAVPFPCPAGGSISASCERVPPRTGKPTYQVTASSCQVPQDSGTLTIEGSLTIVDQTAGHRCFLDQPTEATVEIPSLSIARTAATGGFEAMVNDVTGSFAVSGTDPACTYDRLTLQLTGSIHNEVTPAGGGSPAVFDATMDALALAIEVSQYADGCAPEEYSITLDGAATVSTGESDFAATYQTLRLDVERISEASLVGVSGVIASQCMGGPVTFSTTDRVEVPLDAACPSGGRVLVQSKSTDAITYTAPAQVVIDLGNDGSTDETFPSCLDPRLYICPSS